ncbi:hypothetical protein FDB79_08965 [Clostridium botulinum]|nr:hypothetical protein [Clostridium botulinum]
MIKIIMDSGKEYKSNLSIKEFTDKCFIKEEMPNGLGATIPIIKPNMNYMYISEDIIIHPQHISSIENITDENKKTSKNLNDLIKGHKENMGEFTEEQEKMLLNNLKK